MSSNQNHHDEQVKKVEYDTTPTLALGVFGAVTAIMIVASVGFVWWLVTWQGTRLLQKRSALQKRVILDSSGKAKNPYKHRVDYKALVVKGGTDRYQEAGAWKTEKVAPIAVAMQTLLKNKGFVQALPSAVRVAPVKRVAPKKVAPKKATPKKAAPVKRAVVKRVVPVKKAVVKKAAPAKRVAAPVKRVAPKAAAPKAAAPVKRVVAPKKVAPKKAAPVKAAPVKRAAPAKRVVVPAKAKTAPVKVVPAKKAAPTQAKKTAKAPATREVKKADSPKQPAKR